ncbi:hypothetical protein DFH11DRAFT_539278 [Phellopilus nigrolimitatus]|nr:hypothetical protein DFH11DRAFT_539278 [Phellopilus nigrolimitatus]
MSYKSSNFRRGQKPADAPADKSDPMVEQLQEMFPMWTPQDLSSVIRDTNGDLELAVVRISEGHAEQWGSVTRKKEKRATGGAAQTKDTHGGSDRERGEPRGVRGGRGGGRGARGGARGSGRGGHRETNGRHASSPAPQVHAQADSLTTGAWGKEAPTSTEDVALSGDWGNANGSASNGAAPKSGDSGDASGSAPAVEPTSTSDWGTIDTGTNAWGNGAAAAAAFPEPKSQAPTPAPVPVVKPVLKVPVSKVPATSKMSWAQIAKPQDKPKVAPAPVPPPSALTPASAPPPEPVVAPAETEPQAQPEAQGWEEPTTAQAPTWDDEPQPQTTLPTTSDGWITSTVDIADAQPEVEAEREPAPPVQPEPEPEPVSVPSAFPAQLGLHQKAESPIVPPAKSTTPVSYARSLNSRAGQRFKARDQAVIMPSTFGSSLEKLGMQFGSVNLGGDDVTDTNAPEPAAQEVPTAASAAPEPVREVQSQATHASPVPEPALPAPASATAHTPVTSTQSLFQHPLPQQTQQVQPQQIHASLQSAQRTPPSLLSNQLPPQSSISSQTISSTATSTPLSSFSTQQATPSSQSSISPYQQHSSQHVPPHAQVNQTQAPAPSQIQPQSQLHQQFPHFPSHLDPASSQQSPPQSQPQQPQSSIHQGIGSHGSYFRQPEQNYFHAPTPPAGQAQEAPYGSFAPLSQQLGHQAQGSHLSGFGSDHFGYNDGQRGFYDSYGQQSSFGGRNGLGHDDIGKALPGAQQPSQPSGLPQPAPQTAQQQTTQQPQSAAQPQAAAAGQPQQGYAPVPYYYNPYHQPSQFYGSPYGSGYGLGQYANRYQPQQPPMFQAPTSASPANAKGPATVQPQSNPYTQGLYGQQHASSAYDDGYSHHNQLTHQHSQGASALPSSDYSKLYGAQGIQSFMGVSQSSGPAAPLAQRGAAGGGSPENTYKPYGPGVGAKDVGGAPGVGGSIAGGQAALGQAARTSVQPQPHSQGFYGANRFSANPSVGGPPSQQAQPQQQSQGYPQGGADNSFYYQRGPSQQQQQPYWQ